VLPGVIVKYGKSPRNVEAPAYSTENMQVNQREFAVQVDSVGSFYTRDGKEVEYHNTTGADNDWVKLYLNGQVLVALLHQRKIINFHASSFIFRGRGVMILGETGAGKSSLTLAFALRQEDPFSSPNVTGVIGTDGFLTDDLTPVIFREGIPFIWPLSRRVKIREGTALQLNIERGRLVDAEAGTGKKYLSLDPAVVEDYALHTILKIETGDVTAPEFYEPSSAERFSLLRSEICSWEILAGMPETEAAYLQQLLQIVQQVNIVKLVRPVEIEIVVLHDAVSRYLKGMDA